MAVARAAGKIVQQRLGRLSAAIALDTYAHLWPDADDRTREAVDVRRPTGGVTWQPPKLRANWR
ncbi:MAG: hypothetical protein ACRDRZ_11095 [Pseudonocardiaceae bacterium]